MSIDHVNLARMELRLLIAFDALIRERHVTRAAERIGLGQSATSHALSRLRKLFGDELLVRSGAIMVPTPRALALAQDVAPILEALQSTVLAAAVFEPGETRRAFNIGVSSSLEIALAPALVGAVRVEAPHAQLAFRTASPDRLLDAIDSGSLDVALGAFTDGAHHHRRRVLCDSEGYLCMYDPQRLGLGPAISMQEFLRVPQITVLSNDDAGHVLDRALEAMGVSRRVAMQTQNPLAVPYVVKGADVVAVMCRRTAGICAAAFDLATSELPFELPLQSVAMVWHSSVDRDPMSIWLRSLIASAIPWDRQGVAGKPFLRSPGD